MLHFGQSPRLELYSHGQLRAEVAVQDLDALQVGPMAAAEALPRLRQALLRCCQAGRIPQLEEAPAWGRLLYLVT